MRYTGPKARLCRREGINLFGTEKYQKILNKRKGLPGFKRPTRVKMTDYGKQLREKQKLKIIYGVTEKQLRNIYKKAVARDGITADNMTGILEMRLDNIIYRAGFAATRMQARQFASHGHFMVNGRRVNVPSISLRPEDTIQLRERLAGSPLWQNIEVGDPARWLTVDPASKSIKVKDYPSSEDFDQLVEVQLVLESYSR